jgi:hypothetical protein
MAVHLFAIFASEVREGQVATRTPHVDVGILFTQLPLVTLK